MWEQLGKPIPSPAVLGQITEKFRESGRRWHRAKKVPLYQFDHKERKDDVANRFRQQRGIRDGIVFIGVAQERRRRHSKARRLIGFSSSRATRPFT
jgi:hypothetical protein